MCGNSMYMKIIWFSITFKNSLHYTSEILSTLFQEYYSTQIYGKTDISLTLDRNHHLDNLNLFRRYLQIRHPLIGNDFSSFRNIVALPSDSNIIAVMQNYPRLFPLKSTVLARSSRSVFYICTSKVICNNNENDTKSLEFQLGYKNLTFEQL